MRRLFPCTEPALRGYLSRRGASRPLSAAIAAAVV